MAEEKRKPGRPPGSKNKAKTTKDEPKTTKKQTKEVKVGSKVKDEIWAIIIIAIGGFFIISLQTTAAGYVGQILKNVMLDAFGVLAYALPYYLLIYGILLFIGRAAHISGRSVFYLIMIFLLLVLINASRFVDVESFAFTIVGIRNLFVIADPVASGGYFGIILGTMLAKAIGIWGLRLLAVALICIFLLLVLNTPVSQFFEGMRINRQQRRLRKEAEREADIQWSESQAQTASKTKPTEPVIPPVTAKKAETVKPVVTPIKAKTEPVFAAHEPEQYDFYETNYVPGTMSAGQRNIMDYMKDEELFAGGDELGEAESTGVDESFGLDGVSTVAKGFGLEGELLNDSETEAVHPDEQVIAAAAASGVALSAIKTEDKLTNSEARKAMLTEEELNTEVKQKPYIMPSIELLTKPKETSKAGRQVLAQKAQKLEDTLKSFNVDARVSNVVEGPAVTRYEIQPAVGVKVSSIVRLADDIALNLEAKNIRIEAPIPGKAAVGIEVENSRINLVTLREIISSPDFQNAKSKISFSVGKDITGKSIVGDLKSMPHLLIAGSTGSGKSVCVNGIIMSILYKAKPEEVKLVLIDPKVVELVNYNGIPHLLIPVVTEPGKAAAALNWAVAEMNERYKKFAEEGVRDLETYNNTVKKKQEKEKVMPQIVIIIDELADLMMAAPSQVEESICRLAQMARAAGMHLIVATQRPSVDVVTGVIKANIPSRIAFAVSSQVDSRTILDMSGAEKLVGKGDMLYNPLGLGKPIRVQGAFVSDDEVHKVLNHVKSQVGETEYAHDVINTIEKANIKEGDDGDEFLAEAIEAVVTSKQASVSMLQRRFRIGYNRAARIMDMMEARGIIGPPDGSRPRQVLMTETELYALQDELNDGEPNK